jgi:putative membrane protein
MAFQPKGAVRYFFSGLLMGAADVVPGVSGGTIALVVGIYEKLVEALHQVFQAVMALLRGRGAETIQQFRTIPWMFLLPLVGGIATAILSLARLILYLLAHYPVHLRGLFFGLIAGSLALPWLRLQRRSWREALLALSGAAAAFILVGLPPRVVVDPALWQVFGAAAVAVCAMILPGVSGAFLLLVLGFYEPTLQALTQRNLPYLLVFIAGMATGLGVFVRLLRYLLLHWHDITMAVLVGLMAGSLRAIWPWMDEERQLLLPTATDPIISVVLLALAGLAFVGLLSRWELRQRQMHATPL